MSRYDDEVFRRLVGMLGSLGAPGTFVYATELRGQLLAHMTALAAHERVTPAFDEALAVRNGGAVAKPIRAVAAIRLEENRQRNRAIRTALLELGHAAAAEGFAFAVMKGAAWVLEEGEAAAPWRWMVDIDVLVDPDRFLTLASFMERLGWRPFVGGKSDGVSFQAPYANANAPCLVEVHRHLGWRHTLLAPRAVFQSARTVAPGLLLPAPWCRAFHAIIHWQVQDSGLSRALIRPKDMIDIDRLLRRDDCDWEAVVAQARAAGMMSACEVAVALTTTLMGSPWPLALPATAEGEAHVARALGRRSSAMQSWIAREKWRGGTLWRCE